MRGHKSNRDAIGAQVTVELETGRQSRFLQAGSGFLSQHTKEVFFGVGNRSGPVRATVRWPSGMIQEFDNLPVNCRVEIEEGVEPFRAEPFLLRNRVSGPPAAQKQLGLPSRFETWLIAPPTGGLNATRIQEILASTTVSQAQSSDPKPLSPESRRQFLQLALLEQDS